MTGPLTDPLVVQHCFGAPHEGGPATALSRLQAMRAQPYSEIRQRKAAGGFSAPLIRRFVAELRRLRPQILHVRGLGNEGFHGVLAGRLAGVPRILVSVHGTQRDLVGWGGWRRTSVIHLLEPATLRMADAIVTMCHSAAERPFLDPVRHKLLAPVPNGVSLAGPDELAAGEGIRARLGIASDRIVAIIVSRVTEQKGFADLARAMRHIEAADGTGIDLIVVGNCKGAESIQRLFTGLVHCRVHFVGQSDDVGPYLAAADLFVFPSWHENLSNALLEAMAYSLPVVATAVGGNVEVLSPGGGLLVPARDAKALAGAMLRLVRDADAREAMGRAAFETIVQQYSLDRMKRLWEERYRTIAATLTPQK